MMSVKPFRLESICRLREAERDQRRAELADAISADRLLLEKIEQLDREAGAWQQQAKQAAAGRIDVDRLAGANRYRWLLTAQKQQFSAQREKLQQEIERRRAALVEADRNLKALEKLAERHRESERARQWRDEQKALDEAGVQGWVRAEKER